MPVCAEGDAKSVKGLHQLAATHSSSSTLNVQMPTPEADRPAPQLVSLENDLLDVVNELKRRRRIIKAGTDLGGDAESCGGT